MFVINRRGEKEPVRYDKITDRNIELANLGSVQALPGLPILKNLDISQLSQVVIQGLKNGMTTTQIDILSAETAFFMSTYDSEYDDLAVRIAVSNLHKITNPDFVETMKMVYDSTGESSGGKPLNVIGDDFLAFVTIHRDRIQSELEYLRDFSYSYFGFKTLEKSYLIKVKGKVVERPQHLIMRVACAIHGICRRPGSIEPEGNIDKAIETYHLMSKGLFTHASPTLFNAASPNGNYSSCFLLHMDDSLEHIYYTNMQSALISKFGGGIGIDINRVRSKNSTIHSTNGKSDGIIPMVQVLNATARYCNQSGKRKGSIACYIQPWHPDVIEFLHLRDNTPPEEMRARDIFLALWIPDIFMQRVRDDGNWSFIDPNSVPELNETYGDEFTRIYEQAERDGKAIKTIKAQKLWDVILTSQQENGVPYIAFKDNINKKSNQKNIGIIRSSNLCMEIAEHTNKDSVAVCNLASVAVNKFIKFEGDEPYYDFEELGRVVKVIVRNLNKVIDLNRYPVKEAEHNNLAYRPIGIGIQGLADVFAIFKLPWSVNNGKVWTTNPKAKEINRKITETMYYYALESSYEIAQEVGSYDSFEGSPISQGILQYHMWNTSPITNYDWEGLIEKVKKGVRNSLLLAFMPTASTAQILGNTEAFEPITSNIYSRSTQAGDFILLNKHLFKDLRTLAHTKFNGDQTKITSYIKAAVNNIIANDGSVQELDIPDHLKEVYRTVWEISQKVICELAIDRGAFIDQMQSMNIFMAKPNHSALSSLHMYNWTNGQKTSTYYLRTKAARSAIKFSILNTDKKSSEVQDKEKKIVCTDEICTMCSS
jgi:ribonucleoside-diphosphate reductase alpha subunit